MRDQIWYKPDTSIGRRMRHRRWMLGMTRDRLAEEICVSPDHVKTIEGGETAFRIGELSAIAIALEVPVSYFFDDTNGPDPDPCAAAMRTTVDPRASTPANRLFPVHGRAIEVSTA